MFQKLFIILFSLLTLLSCKYNPSSHNDGNGIYYWRTTLSLNDAEREFLKKHNVTRLYIKFFDVDKGWEASKGTQIIPEATIQFKDSVPSGIEIVPTIYITTSAMEAMQLKEEEYAEKIFRRIHAMCRRNGVEFKELQLDCDWTKSTRKYFFKLCEEMKQCMDSTQTLSSTIRLHQLTQTPPPVDKGVLMVYNTGNLMEMTTENSIFSRRDIEPYLMDNRLENYALPLDVAYPAYGWSVAFHPGEDKYYFDKIMRQTDFSSYSGLKQIDKNMFEATEDINLNPESDTWNDVYKGYRIRLERPTAHEILEIKGMIEKKLKDKSHRNILYHLDESQLSHYSDNEIDKIYSCN